VKFEALDMTMAVEITTAIVCSDVLNNSYQLICINPAVDFRFKDRERNTAVFEYFRVERPRVEFRA
jgi:hypothetical protein